MGQLTESMCLKHASQLVINHAHIHEPMLLSLLEDKVCQSNAGLWPSFFLENHQIRITLHLEHQNALVQLGLRGDGLSERTQAKAKQFTWFDVHHFVGSIDQPNCAILLNQDLQIWSASRIASCLQPGLAEGKQENSKLIPWQHQFEWQNENYVLNS